MWWRQWSAQMFPNIIPYKSYKDARQHEYLQQGDVCLLKFEGKIRADYRLCHVVELKSNTADLVRTVKINIRPRHKRDAALPYKSKVLQEIDVSVKRLCLIHPVEDPLELAAAHIITATGDDQISGGDHYFHQRLLYL